MSSMCLVEASASVARTLVRESIWADDRCSWLGHSLSEVNPGFPATVAPLGPDLYAGTAGVAWFLADLAAVTQDREVRRTAEGAMRHALSCVESLARGSLLSLYNGGLGIALASSRAGQSLGNEELREQAVAVARRSLALGNADGPLDVVSGNAGAMLALLSIGEMESCNELVDAAERLADRLASAAIKHEGTWSWSSRAASGTSMGPRPLTGFSHGASGMAVALLEVSRRTKRVDLANGARAAFAYEDLWFSDRHDNWPDFRDDGITPIRSPTESAYAFAWCHGAPGCALARVRALEHGMAADRLRTGVEAGVRLVLRQLSDPFSEDVTDATLCHGVGGVLELLIAAAPVLDRPALVDEAVRVWERLIAQHAAEGSWPSGLVTRGRAPGLMIGLSGVGHGLLRACGLGSSVLMPCQ